MSKEPSGKPPAPDEPEQPEFDQEWKRQEHAAKRQLSEAQGMLDKWDSDDADNVDGDETITIDAVELDDGESTLADFMEVGE